MLNHLRILNVNIDMCVYINLYTNKHVIYYIYFVANNCVKIILCIYIYNI